MLSQGGRIGCLNEQRFCHVEMASGVSGPQEGNVMADVKLDSFTVLLQRVAIMPTRQTDRLPPPRLATASTSPSYALSPRSAIRWRR